MASTARGAPWFWRVSRNESPVERCQLLPRHRYVPGHAAGYAIAGPSGDFRVRDVQGQMRMGPSSTILTEEREGRLRFPSGYIQRFACSPEAPVVLEEPAWLSMTLGEERLLILSLVTPEQEVESVQVLMRSSEGAVLRAEAQQVEATWQATLAEDITDVMVVVDGFHVARWWPVEALP